MTNRPLRIVRAVLALGVFQLLVGHDLMPRATAQEAVGNAALAAQRGASELGPAREIAAELVNAMESANGRPFDAVYRARLEGGLSARPAAELLDLQSRGDRIPFAVTNLLGDSSADLVFTPVAPCRVFDTRSAVAGILVGGTQRNFLVAGAAGFAAQGGNAAGCGVPLGPATSVIINFAAVTPTGTGNLRAWAVANPQPAAPTAAVMNFSTLLPALANGVAVPICDVAATTCASDLRLQADVSSLHVVGDVVGYFRKVDILMGASTAPSLTLVSGNNRSFASTTVTPSTNTTCHVTVHIDIEGTANNTGHGFSHTVIRNDTTAVETADSLWGVDLPDGGVTWGTASGGAVYSLTAGNTYRFGCQVNASGDFIGDPIYCNVTWVCR